MIVSVNMNFITRATFKMDNLDSIGDVKHFLNEVSAVPIANITLKITGDDGKWFEPSDDMTFEALGMVRETLTIQMVTSSKEDFSTVEKIRFAQDECRHNNIESIDFKDGVIVTSAGAFIASHGLHVPVVEDEPSPSPTPVVEDEPSLSPTPVVEEETPEVAQLRLQIDGMTIDELLALIFERERQLKIIKKQLSLRKKEKKGEDITINLLQPSGRSIPHVVKPKKNPSSEAFNRGSLEHGQARDHPTCLWYG